MGRIGRCVGWAVLIGAVLLGIAWPLACTQHHVESPPSPATPVVRVRLLVGETAVTIRATSPPTVKTASEPSPLRLNIAPGAAPSIVLTESGWQIGGMPGPGRGELTLWPAQVATVSINEKLYRGRYRFVPAGLTSFDVMNDVDVDSYLKSVLPRELRRGWNEETYRAQAIAARTYALYEGRTRGPSRSYDLKPDESS